MTVRFVREDGALDWYFEPRSRRSKSCNCHEVPSVACAQLRMAHRPCTLGFSGDMSKGSSMVACCLCGNSVIGN
jgi:hypothetical protein